MGSVSGWGTVIPHATQGNNNNNNNKTKCPGTPNKYEMKNYTITGLPNTLNVPGNQIIIKYEPQSENMI